MKIDKIIIKESGYIAVVSFVFSVIMQLIFLIFGAWSLSVLAGNILGLIIGISNFFIMGITIQSVLGQNASSVKRVIGLSQIARLIVIGLIIISAAMNSLFNTIAVLVPLIFPRLALSLRTIIKIN